MRKPSIPPTVLALAILVAITGACKEGDPISSRISPAAASFAEHAPPAGTTDHLVTLKVGSASGGRITLDVVLTQIDEPVRGIALKLSYPRSFSKFLSCADGTLFPPDACSSSEFPPGSGEVFIWRGVTGVAQATPVDGSRVAVRLEFLVFGTGQGEIRFEAQNLAGGDASAVLDVNNDPIFAHWVAGTLIGR